MIKPKIEVNVPETADTTPSLDDLITTGHSDPRDRRHNSRTRKKISNRNVSASIK